MTNNPLSRKGITAGLAAAKLSVRGFSLVEILVVMAIISVMAASLPTVFSSLVSAGKLTQSASDISSVLERAKTYAMAKNTYVYVGLQEVDGNKPSSANGVGEVVVATVASMDGNRPYTSGALNAADIAAIDAPRFFLGAHLTSGASLVNGASMTSRPTASVDLSGASATTTFQFPVTGTAQFNFTKVVEFDPQGIARVQTGTGFNSSVQPYIEIPLVPAHGNVAAVNIHDQAAVQVDGITGGVAIYRP